MEIEIGRLMRAIRRYWSIPIVGAILLGLIGFGGASLVPTTYTATTRLLIVPPEVVGPSVVNGSATVLIDLATSQPVLEQVITDLDLDMSYLSLADSVYAAQQRGTQYILISVTHEDPELASQISIAVSHGVEARANEMTLTQLTQRQFALESESNNLAGQLATTDAQLTLHLQTEGADSVETDALRSQRLSTAQQKADVDRSLRDVRAQIAGFYSEVSIVDPARVPGTPSGLGPVVYAIVGGFVGAVLGSAAILFMATRNRTVVNTTQVARIVGKPVLREVSSDEIESGIRLINRLFGPRSGSSGHVAPGRIALVAPTALQPLRKDSHTESHDDVKSVDATIAISNGIVGNDAELVQALKSTAAVLAVQVGVTSENDLREGLHYLRVAEVTVLGSLVLKEK